MSRSATTLVCWRSERAGDDVLRNSVDLLRRKQCRIRKVLYLVQRDQARRGDVDLPGIDVEQIEVAISNPTRHKSIYRALLKDLCPRLTGPVHVNVSPGTPAMHAVWLVLHADERLPPGSHLWSSQLDRRTNTTRIDPVTFPVSTYLSEVSRVVRASPNHAVYESDAKSDQRRRALERLARLARLPGAPLLVLGERGTGKTRLVETFVAALKRREKVVTVPCGGLNSTIAESTLFGHVKGAYTGAESDRPGLLADAAGGILFLDEVQDLPHHAQRMLVRALQDSRRRYRPVGSDEELSSDAELVCASNLTMPELRKRLDADLFDRVSLLAVEVPALRDCREDLQDDWRRVWGELRRTHELPVEPPWTGELATALGTSDLPGNLRDLQRLALLVAAWWTVRSAEDAVRRALEEWGSRDAARSEDNEFGAGTRRERIRWFSRRLAHWARGQWGTWDAAAQALHCDERTLRDDARGSGSSGPLP
jgi:transcriptional regulator with AAA-type ATPase domain